MEYERRRQHYPGRIEIGFIATTCREFWLAVFPTSRQGRLRLDRHDRRIAIARHGLRPRRSRIDLDGLEAFDIAHLGERRQLCELRPKPRMYRLGEFRRCRKRAPLHLLDDRLVLAGPWACRRRWLLAPDLILRPFRSARLTRRNRDDQHTQVASPHPARIIPSCPPHGSSGVRS